MQIKIAVTFILIAMVFIGFSPALETNALSMHEALFERSLAAFGIAKALNGVISLIQGTELSFAPVGIGVTFSVGEVLDPMNDLIERFSWIMLFTSISLGIQKLLLLISSKLFLQLALFATAALMLVLLWIKQPLAALFSVSLRFFTLLLLLRFSVILFVMFETMTFNTLLKQDYNQAMSDISRTNSELQAIERQTEDELKKSPESHSWLSSAKENVDKLSKSLQIQQKLQAMQKSIDQAQEQIIHLATLFVFQNILLPLLFLWLLAGMIRWSMSKAFNTYAFYEKIRGHL